MLELHVWGPAFGLPSIDAHCLAAIAYLEQTVPRGKWQLVASSNPALSPTNELPALRNTESGIWIGGFRNIYSYLGQISAGEWVLDAGLPELDGADCIAFSSFIETHGQPLLDLSLYVSSQNYISVTRPIFNTIQPFPLPYLTPPALRSAAKARTEHLGLSSLDLDTENTSEPPMSQSIIPESLRKPKNTISSMFAANPETGAQIRLDGLARDFFEPLELLRRDGKFFGDGEGFTSLDCLALGYLCLMLIPELPQPWLSKTMRGNFGALSKWTEKRRRLVFGKDVDLDYAFLGAKEGWRNSHLPWTKPDSGGTVGVGGVFASGVADMIPVVGSWRRNTRMQQPGKMAAGDNAQSSSWQYFGLIGSVLAGMGLAVGYMFHEGLIPYGSRETESSGLGGLGEAGEALSFFATAMDADVERQRMMQNQTEVRGDPVVEVEVDMDRRGVTTVKTTG